MTTTPTDQKEYCLYCGREVTGDIRSPNDNPMCMEHYNKVYGGGMPSLILDILKGVDVRQPANTFVRMTKEDKEMFINWLGEIKHPLYYEFCTDEWRFISFAKEFIGA